MKRNEKMTKEVIELLKNMRATKPLVDCITNTVTINDCANILLASGASPIMAEDIREVEEIVSISKGLVLNIGVLTETTIEAMVKAGKHAKKIGVPVIFDPVGAGASKLRDDTAARILSEVKPDVIRGNMSEIKALSGSSIKSCGVDASADDTVTEDNYKAFGEMVFALAKEYSCVVCATGAIDVISDGKQTFYVKNGDSMLCDVTGTGCMCSALTGATCASGGHLTGAVAAVVLLGLSGEYAAEYCRKTDLGIGTFRIKMLDFIYTIREKELLERSEIYAE